MRAQRPLLRIEQFVPALLRRRNFEGLGHKFIPRIQIVSAFGSDRAGQHVQQHQGPRRLPSAEISGSAAAPQVRREAASCGRNLARSLDDDVRLDSAFFFGELRRELRVVFFQGFDERFKALAFRA